MLTRREWLARAASAAAIGGAGMMFGGCHLLDIPEDQQPKEFGTGRLSTTFKAPTGTTTPGLTSLGLDTARDAQRYVPAGYDPTKPSPLVVMLHGAGGNATDGMAPFRSLADASGFILLAPMSRANSWDITYGHFGADLTFIDKALAQTFSVCNVDPTRIAIAGFSDGASYSLSLGMSNGDLFKRLVAFSPGFISPGEVHERPLIFISHGIDDPILPIAQTSRLFVPQLQNAGYTVTYQEFYGGHGVPASIAQQAADWLKTA